MIEFVIQMSAFHRRFHWMLSGLCQQTGGVPAFRLRVDLAETDPYRDLTAGLQAAFDSLLDIEWHEHGDRAFGQRGGLRNAALQESAADWLLFSDADMMYPPAFMADLASQYLNTGQYDTSLLSVVRRRTTVAITDALVADADYGGPIPDAFGRARAAWVSAPDGESIARATGYFQLCRRTEALKRGTYCQRDRSHDVPLRNGKGGNFRSDVQFRRGWPIVALDLPPLIHLRHQRTWKNEWDGACR